MDIIPHPFVADRATADTATNRSEHGTRNSGANGGFGRGYPWRLGNGDSAIDDLRLPPARDWIPLRMRRIPTCHLEPHLVQSRFHVSMHDVMVFLQELNSRFEIPTVPLPAPASKVGPTSGLVNSPGPYVRPPDGTARDSGEWAESRRHDASWRGAVTELPTTLERHRCQSIQVTD